MIIGSFSSFSSFSFESLFGGLFFDTNLVNNAGQWVCQLVVVQGEVGPGAIFILVFGLAGFGAMRRRAA